MGWTRYSVGPPALAGLLQDSGGDAATLPGDLAGLAGSAMPSAGALNRRVGGAVWDAGWNCHGRFKLGEVCE